jgi:hypothetical protein
MSSTVKPIVLLSLNLMSPACPSKYKALLKLVASSGTVILAPFGISSSVL